MPKAIVSTFGDIKGEMEVVRKLVSTPRGTRSRSRLRNMSRSACHSCDTAAGHQQKLDGLLVVAGCSHCLDQRERALGCKCRYGLGAMASPVACEHPVLLTTAERRAGMSDGGAKLTAPKRSAPAKYWLHSLPSFSVFPWGWRAANLATLLEQ